MPVLVHTVANLAPPVLGALETILVALEIGKGLHDLFFRVENKGAILHDGLVERSAGDDD